VNWHLTSQTLVTSPHFYYCRSFIFNADQIAPHFHSQFALCSCIYAVLLIYLLLWPPILYLFVDVALLLLFLLLFGVFMLILSTAPSFVCSLFVHVMFGCRILCEFSSLIFHSLVLFFCQIICVSCCCVKLPLSTSIRQLCTTF
jgi:hypothetical protein